METISEIITDMREFADADSQSIGRDVLRRRIQHFADSIEQAVTNCNQLKMREALVELIANIEMRSSTFGLNVMVDTKTFLDAKKALSAPPRNCDLYATEDEAWQAFCGVHPDAKCPSDYWSEQYQMWLFAEVKGETK